MSEFLTLCYCDFRRDNKRSRHDEFIPADLADLASTLAFPLRIDGRRRTHSAEEIMAEIVAKRLVERLESAGFVVMKQPAEISGAAPARRFG